MSNAIGPQLRNQNSNISFTVIRDRVKSRFRVMGSDSDLNQMGIEIGVCAGVTYYIQHQVCK